MLFNHINPESLRFWSLHQVPCSQGEQMNPLSSPVQAAAPWTSFTSVMELPSLLFQPLSYLIALQLKKLKHNATRGLPFRFWLFSVTFSVTTWPGWREPPVQACSLPSEPSPALSASKGWKLRGGHGQDKSSREKGESCWGGESTTCRH